MRALKYAIIRILITAVWGSSYPADEGLTPNAAQTLRIDTYNADLVRKKT
ncbi:MAG: hypothetical protein NWR06_01470 [Paracoccaceae bacterium]|nr:hypothetical protein [Paracoccaceae bacterium]MDO7633191.1 hypothetical protein [Paracoccaceae bacterium]MDO7654242.1 hypothetical protein [Paracoccaceae bacterium]MDO7659036.1 hypothetical protein [Paracoccaceae bacterium]MDO7733328.1 hypothetical protein [Paracoccaceae bacterium]